ncbi:MAG: outer membrane beta-barrel domain-containing protein [Gammaproteobacteria bacterium]|nr:outer membrane beta-barrel domain-containing protein [Gammaproteobacteria bacterium]
MKDRYLAIILLLLFSPLVSAFDIVNPDAEQALIKDADLVNVGINSGVYIGLMNFENFNSSPMLAWYINYPFDEDLFVSAELGAALVNDSEYRNVGLPLLSEEEVVAGFYSVLLGYNVLPAEVYWRKGQALRADIYLLGGIGSITIDSEDYVALHAGVGLKIEPANGHSLRIEFRDRLINSDILGTDKLTNNTEIHLGIEWSF